MPSKGLIPAVFLFGMTIVLLEPHQSHFQMLLIYSEKKELQVAWPSLESLPLSIKFIHLTRIVTLGAVSPANSGGFPVRKKFLKQLIFHLF